MAAQERGEAWRGLRLGEIAISLSCAVSKSAALCFKFTRGDATDLLTVRERAGVRVTAATRCSKNESLQRRKLRRAVPALPISNARLVPFPPCQES